MTNAVSNQSATVAVLLTTKMGDIRIAVDATAAPDTAAYFLALVDQGRFDGTTFHRTGASFVADSDERQLIQGGLLYRTMTGADRRPIAATGEPLLADFETTELSGLSHQAGTVSLARDLLKTGAAIPEIFICLRDSPEFDANGRTEPDNRGFPAFAQVVEGMDVVKRIAGQERDGETPTSVLAGQILTHPVVIIQARRNPV